MNHRDLPLRMQTTYLVYEHPTGTLRHFAGVDVCRIDCNAQSRTTATTHTVRHTHSVIARKLGTASLPWLQHVTRSLASRLLRALPYHVGWRYIPCRPKLVKLLCISQQTHPTCVGEVTTFIATRSPYLCCLHTQHWPFGSLQIEISKTSAAVALCMMLSHENWIPTRAYASFRWVICLRTVAGE